MNKFFVALFLHLFLKLHKLLLFSDLFRVDVGGCNIEGEADSWEFGLGAGFYIDATTEKWKTNYRMFSYVTKEVPML